MNPHKDRRVDRKEIKKKKRDYFQKKREQDYANGSSEVDGSQFRAAAAILVFVFTGVQENAAHMQGKALGSKDHAPNPVWTVPGPGTKFLGRVVSWDKHLR